MRFCDLDYLFYETKIPTKKKAQNIWNIFKRIYRNGGNNNNTLLVIHIFKISHI